MKKKIAIIAGYYTGETYGLLGPQTAAALINANTDYEAMVVATTREDDPNLLVQAVAQWFGKARPIIGFSLLGGRDDLVQLAGEIKRQGVITLLAGPQAGVDFLGETGWQQHPHRFRGFAEHFSFALQGPAEQLFPFLIDPEGSHWQTQPGFVFRQPDNRCHRNPSARWRNEFLSGADWSTIYHLKGRSLEPLEIQTGQILQQIGCPHAAKTESIQIDDPSFLENRTETPTAISAKGCSFCDVAVDKGFFGALKMETVLDQIAALPQHSDGRKIPFELINENPLPGLRPLLNRLDRLQRPISQIHLTMRADWFIRGEKHLHDALETAREMGVRIVLTSMGFESFDDRILKNLNKGVTVETNLKAVELIRQFKNQYPEHWGYLRSEGGNHGFIHPTPWDTEETAAAIDATASAHQLPADILPNHSTPLIIHHASALGDWIRAIEKNHGVRFERTGSIIAWWQIDDRFVL